MFDLISIGSVTRDVFLLTDRGRIFKTPQDKLAPTWLGFELGEKISVSEIIETTGGVATNLSIGAKKLGLRSLALGPGKSATSTIVIDQKSGERVIFYEKSSGTIDLAKLVKMKSQWLSVSSLTGNWKKQASQIKVYIKQNNAKLILAPSTSMLREGYGNLKNLMKFCEIIFLNKNEALEVAFREKHAKQDTKSLIKLLHKLGPKMVCLTDGRNGAYCSDEKNIMHRSIKKVKTVDVTGAGDAFAAGFLGYFLKGQSREKSLKAGIINSASVVKYVGTTRGLLTKKEIDQMMN
jgi:sugar/nucleoside kinase (ribokinase family)